MSPGLKWDSKVKEKNAMLKWETKEVITLWIKKKSAYLPDSHRDVTRAAQFSVSLFDTLPHIL